MGVYIYLDIAPGRIGKQDWENAYKESLELVQAYPFLNKVVKETDLGNRYVCAVRTQERNDIFGDHTGWISIGDMITGDNTEDFAVYRDLDSYQENRAGIEADNGADILTCQIDNRRYPDVKVIDHKSVEPVFYNKTQGEASHLYLLAVACLIVARFPEAADVYGDINIGQCRAAVRWANEILKEPISLPVQCDASRLLKRIMAIEGADRLGGEILDIFFSLSMENKDAAVGDAIRNLVSRDCILDYFRSHFLDAGEENLSRKVREYFALGFGLEDLIKLLVTDSDGCDLSPDKFFDILFGMQLHVENKRTYDMTEGDKNRETSDNVSMQFARIFGEMGGAYNRNVNRFIPIDEIREVCRHGMGSICDADKEIQDSLDRIEARRRDKGSAVDELQDQLYGDGDSEFRKKVEERRKKEEENQKYDIRHMEDIVYYEPGDTFTPELDDALMNLSGQIHAFNIQTRFDRFLKLDQSGRERQMIEMDDRILMPDRTWDRILENIMNDEYIKRYFSILSVDVSYQRQYDLIHGMLMNPDFVDYFWEKAPDEREQ